MYHVHRLKGGNFKTDSLVYALTRFENDQNISLIVDCSTSNVIVQRIKDREKLDSMQGSWKALQSN